MNILVINILAVLFCLILGYLFGSIPTAVVIGKVFFHKDPRDYGSHNAGGTNAGRLFGKKIGFLVIVLDMLKTIAPMYLVCVLLTFIKFDYSHIEGIKGTLIGSDVARGLICKVTDFTPASSPGSNERTDILKRCASAYNTYILYNISAQSWASVPPAPG